MTGVRLEKQLALGISNCRSVGGLISAVQAASEVGVSHVFLAEDIGCRDAFQLIAAVANTAPDMRFTISVTNPYLRSPAVLAQSVATITDLAGGPPTLGLGSSSAGIISGQLGSPYGDSISIMAESIRAIRQEFQSLMPGFDMKIMLAAMGPRMLRLAGEVADSVILNTGTTPGYVRWARQRILEGAIRSGRERISIPLAVWVPVYVDETFDGSGVQRRDQPGQCLPVPPVVGRNGPHSESEPLQRARRWAASMLSIPRQGELLLEHGGFGTEFLGDLRAVCSAYPHSGDVAAAARIVPDEVVKTLAVVGRPSEVRSRLEALLAAGADTLVVGPSALRAVLS